MRWGVFMAAWSMSCIGQAAVTPPDEGGELYVPLTVHIAHVRGEPVVDESEIVSAVRRANKALDSYDVRVGVAKVQRLSPAQRHVLDSTDRVELARRAHNDGTLHVFFVERVNMSENGQADARVSGLHWRYDGFRWQMQQREYLVVANDAPSTTLAHELGHAFDLGHSTREDNIMCSCRRGPDVRFTDYQGERLRTGARGFLLRSK
jgi:hypothetical protein